MYVDPNTGGILFQALAALFGLFSGLILLFSARIRSGLAAVGRYWRERIAKR
jgi:hypothetical protein